MLSNGIKERISLLHESYKGKGADKTSAKVLSNIPLLILEATLENVPVNIGDNLIISVQVQNQGDLFFKENYFYVTTDTGEGFF